MVLAGSVLGILLCIANLVIIFLKTPWNDYFFAGFTIVGTITFICTEFFLTARSRKELTLLDQVEDTQDITILKSKNNFKQILATGFQFAHPICLDLSIFKLAANEWKDALDMWSLFAKFCAIYPENSQTLQMIRASIASVKTKDKLVGVIIECTNYIIKTRETKYTPQLKTKISKLSKLFMKTRNRQRNIWDLVLQGNISDLSSIIKRTQESVYECEIEMSHLLMQYPSNRFIAKQNMIFLSDVKGDPIEAKNYSETLSKLQRGFTTSEDNIRSLGMIAFPNLPEISNTEQQVQKIKTTDDGLITDDIVIEETVNIEAIESISKQIDNHKIPAIQFIYFSTLLLWFFFIVLPFIAFLIAYQFFAKQLSQPVTFMEGIAQTRNVISMLSGYVNRFLFMQIDDPHMPGTKVGEALQLVEGMTLSHLGGSTVSSEVYCFKSSRIEHKDGSTSFIPA
ncbi:hypothetical protein TVAG_383500 [Trichomonas vaginalis G3]|uniref:Uncharacterized protein n=1 Tax=Trichomonas vaginalis (strain ATCC PRA-98 / G3) TaxID=412133 RepID=A2EZ59_TRIV3|nr:guanylate cyclase protein [Trichomonas vaginalis G3]EAY02047.1 hypothetical protein TVAG_383500 [Trichomonas vaginalis G3]KAI5514278.1 guanylate cyclase protein [Trichomonas vaginalis G3]|eukprot:XP_001330501.1 hypothetical protein [Trichomonas vaginalis G3]